MKDQFWGYKSNDLVVWTPKFKASISYSKITKENFMSHLLGQYENGAVTLKKCNLHSVRNYSPLENYYFKESMKYSDFEHLSYLIFLEVYKKEYEIYLKAKRNHHDRAFNYAMAIHSIDETLLQYFLKSEEFQHG